VKHVEDLLSDALAGQFDGQNMSHGVLGHFYYSSAFMNRCSNFTMQSEI
jgi:hypothetical protein